MNEILLPDFSNILYNRENPAIFLGKLEKANTNTFRYDSGLKRTAELLSLWNNPQDNYPIVLIGGTAGKGSTATILNSILQESGLNVGLFTSPTIINFYEQIQVNGNFITPHELVEYLKSIHNLHYNKDITWDNGFPTRFESMCSIAADYFHKKNVDIGIFEVGLGGKFDATNVLPAKLSIITNVDLEHMQILGNTIKEISKHKAGIIKNNKMTITASSNKITKSIIKSECKRKNSEYIYVDTDSYKYIDNKNFTAKYSFNTKCNNYENIKCNLKGEYQIKNAMLACVAAESISLSNDFKTKNNTISKDTIIRGIEKAYLPARMEVYSNNPYIIVDGAHNPCKMQAFANCLPKNMKYRWLISITAGKNVEQMFKILFETLQGEHSFIFTAHNIETDYYLHSIQPSKLKDELDTFIDNEKRNKNIIFDEIAIGKITIEENPYDAFNLLKRQVLDDEIGIVTGSLYLISQLFNDNDIRKW